MNDKNKLSHISVPEAAAIMGVTPQFLRMALQQGKFTIRKQTISEGVK